MLAAGQFAPVDTMSVASAQTVQDVAIRDRLIIAQEALLNAYRCQFDIDTQIVPGGCPYNPTLEEQPEPVAAPSADARYTALVSGGDYTCGLRIDQTAVCWGYNSQGQLDPPQGERFTALTAGGAHTCGLRPDQTVVCWGNGTWLVRHP